MIKNSVKLLGTLHLPDRALHQAIGELHFAGSCFASICKACSKLLWQNVEGSVLCQAIENRSSFLSSFRPSVLPCLLAFWLVYFLIQV